MSSSCSFRITRTAEDLAQTVSALSQRLIKLEQRQEALEIKLRQTTQSKPAPEEVELLNGVDQILQECQQLLDSSLINDDSEEEWNEEENQEELTMLMMESIEKFAIQNMKV